MPAATSKSGWTRSPVFSSTWMTWYPNELFTGPTISFSFAENAASSNSFTMRPLGNEPRSPPFAFEPGSSDSAFARVAKSAPARSLRTAASALAFCEASFAPSTL